MASAKAMGNRAAVPASTPVMSAEEKLYMEEIQKIHARPQRGATSMPAKLTEYLFVGGYGEANSIARIKKRGITHVLNCASVRDYKGNPYPPDSGVVDFAQFHGEDSDSYDILSHYEMASTFITSAKEYGGRVLVHCAVGVNRSCTTCLAYLMAEENMDLLSAMELMKERRGTVPSNKHFRLELVRFAMARGRLKPPQDLTL